MRRKLPGFALIANVSATGDEADAAAHIQLFYAVPNPITAGERVVMFWEIPNTPRVRIVAQGLDTGAMVNDPQGGYLVLDPGPRATRTYTITALDDNGNPIVQNGANVSGSLTITVR